MERAGKKIRTISISLPVGRQELWQQRNNPIELNTQKIAWQKLECIHENPGKAGFVENPEDYVYSSARSYYGIKGLIEIDFPGPLIITLKPWHK